MKVWPLPIEQVINELSLDVTYILFSQPIKQQLNFDDYIYIKLIMQLNYKQINKKTYM